MLRALVDPHFMLFISVTLFSVCAWLCVVFAPTRAVPAARCRRGQPRRFRIRCGRCGAPWQTSSRSPSPCYSFSLPVSDGMSWGATALQEVWLQPPYRRARGCRRVRLQLFPIDVCLASGAVTYAVPLYQALLVSLEIIAAAIFFRELEHEPIARLSLALGVMVATMALLCCLRAKRTLVDPLNPLNQSARNKMTWSKAGTSRCALVRRRS